METINGKYISLTELKNGNLQITLNTENLVDANEIYDTFKQGNNSYNGMFWDLLEDIICNSSFDLLAPENVNALTDSLLIGFDFELNDSGKYCETDTSKLWWYENYQIICPIETLFKNNVVIFENN